MRKPSLLLTIAVFTSMGVASVSVTAASATEILMLEAPVDSGNTVSETPGTEADLDAPVTEDVADVDSTVTLADSTVTLAPSTITAQFGDEILLSATVTGQSPTGTVEFLSGSTVIGSTEVGADGQANLRVNSLSVGTHNLVARYLGDENNRLSVAEGIHVTVTPFVATVSLIATPTPVVFGNLMTLTATVAGHSPTGTVHFYANNLLQGVATVTENGVAVFRLATLAIGTHVITAVYSGDESHAAANSAGVGVSVSAITEVPEVPEVPDDTTVDPPPSNDNGTDTNTDSAPHTDGDSELAETGTPSDLLIAHTLGFAMIAGGAMILGSRRLAGHRRPSLR